MSCFKMCRNQPETDKELVKVIKTTFTPTGNEQADKARGENYAKAVGMDEANNRIAVIASTKGMEEAAKTMISDFTDSKGKLDYFAMRSAYG